MRPSLTRSFHLRLNMSLLHSIQKNKSQILCRLRSKDALDGYESASASGDEVQESESQKLTRAQRKKIRKKKLKEEAIRRGKLIGPLLPTNGDLDAHEGANHPPGVRSNASESQEYCGADEPGPPTSKKVNQRRKAKRMAKGKQNSSNSENPNQHPTSNPSVDLKDDH
ncbi:uncharacterized protein LOC129311446 isoform X1 [Prosopis cineraria]|uniref:uncharacterized protein LOC129311446 isoform X1 n=1 Tax=Prosopis cineraria TaxID=364024 RepID=UPI00240ED9C9|nr:uncharacterized protein LOC129311446 isoform X1 [Prosopis cineraria]